MAESSQKMEGNPSSKAQLKPRPPVVVVMGHVDHGKTTLLDYIRKTSVAAREAGGITQAIGAYEIEHNLRKITFIDTPGHEAFTAMRSRGAQVADLAVLVVAADDGVKPQTKEAIGILQKTETPFVVAINKIDKAGSAGIERAKSDLLTTGVLLEGFGGQISYHGISAKTGEGVAELLDLLILTADLENLTYDPAAPASGYILEAKMDRQRGGQVVAILKNGTLKRGDELATPSSAGKVKILENFQGKAASELSPSSPAIILGFASLPKVGEEFLVGGKPAPKTAAPAKIAAQGSANRESEKPKLPLILKAEDAGSLEALSLIVKGISHADTEIEIVGELVGDVTDGDVKQAIATGATIVGFKVRVARAAENLSESKEVRIITAPIIYDLVTAIEEFLAHLGKPVVTGELEVLAVFNQEKFDKQLVGGRVLKGIFRKANFEVVRPAEGDKIADQGKILSLREKKSDISEAGAGKEIGILVSAKSAIKAGDHILIRK